jgi:hypothetical protein
MDRIHEISVKNYKGNLEELATEVGRMRYDALIVFLEALEGEINRQADGDFHRGRERLANELILAAEKIHRVADIFTYIWKEYCAKHMEGELKERPSLLRD